MSTFASVLRDTDVCKKSVELNEECNTRLRLSKQSLRYSATIDALIVVEFRDEVFAAIAQLLRCYNLPAYRARSAPELAETLGRHQAELILLSATQPDESAWLTSAKLRIVDSYRSVWIYTPNRPSAIDEWLSMAGVDDVIDYGGVLHSLIDSLQLRLAFRHSLARRVSA